MQQATEHHGHLHIGKLDFDSRKVWQCREKVVGYKADSDGIQTDSHTTQVAECSNQQNTTDKQDTNKVHAHTTQVAECNKSQKTNFAHRQTCRDIPWMPDNARSARLTSDGFEYNQITVGTKIAKYMKSSSRLKKFKKNTNQHKLPNAATNKTPQTNETQRNYTHIQHKLPNAASYRTPRTFTHWEAWFR